MKKLICLLVLSILICTSVQAQKKTFLRFYDSYGHKFGKGQFVISTDSSIVVFRNTALIEIPISRIYLIRTKRSYGHNALVGSVLIGIPLTIYATSTGEPPTNENTFSGILHDSVTFTPGEAALLGVFGSVVGGAITGAILSGNSKILAIDGNIENWRQFESRIVKTLVQK